MKIFIIIIVIIVIILAFVGYRAGLFHSVKITEKEIDTIELVYEEHTGSYSETGKLQDKIYYKLLNNEEIETYKGIGIYYDDPKETQQEKLRSKVGCIIEPADYDRIDKLENNYNVMEISGQKMIYTEFPYRSKMAIMAGIFKVYPKIEKYRQDKGYPKRESIEIYDLPNKKIIYLMPIEK